MSNGSEIRHYFVSFLKAIYFAYENIDHATKVMYYVVAERSYTYTIAPINMFTRKRSRTTNLVPYEALVEPCYDV